MSFLSSNKAFNSKVLKYSNIEESMPPIIYKYSFVNLKGADSKPIFPGEFYKIKPKSIWIICPSESINIFPLCLSFTLNK